MLGREQERGARLRGCMRVSEGRRLCGAARGSRFGFVMVGLVCMGMCVVKVGASWKTELGQLAGRGTKERT